MTETNYKIINTRCPEYNEKISKGSEMLLLSEGKELTRIICPRYSNGRCKIKDEQDKCIYLSGWETLKIK